MPKTATRINKVGLVIVPVSDQERALAFYTENLGFEKRSDVTIGTPPDAGMRWLEIGLPGEDTTLAIVPPRQGDPVGRETGIALNTDDADAIHAELKDKGVDVDAEVSRMGDPVPPMFWFRDPDGNSLFIVETSS